MSRFAKFVRDESGVTIAEFGIAAALIAIMIFTIWTTLGERLGARL